MVATKGIDCAVPSSADKAKAMGGGDDMMMKRLDQSSVL